MSSEQNGQLPRDNLVRAVHPGFEMREAEEGEGRTLVTRFAVYDQWSEINSLFEGHFLERFARGAFKKTMRERRDQLRILLNHGHDPQLGDKPIAAIEDLRDEDEGPFAEARLLDGLPELVMDGLRSGQYGASHRFSVVREEVVDDPDASPSNPHRLQERTIKEAKLYEFGPVTFPAYQGATAGVRSLTDHFILDELLRHPERSRLLDSALERLIKSAGTDVLAGKDPDPECDRNREDAPSTPDADREVTSDQERRANDQEPKPLVLPSRAKRGGVLSSKEEDGSWRPLRLP